MLNLNNYKITKKDYPFLKSKISFERIKYKENEGNIMCNEYEGFKIGDIVDIISKSIGEVNITPYIKEAKEKYVTGISYFLSRKCIIVGTKGKASGDYFLPCDLINLSVKFDLTDIDVEFCNLEKFLKG